MFWHGDAAEGSHDNRTRFLRHLAHAASGFEGDSALSHAQV